MIQVLFGLNFDSAEEFVKELNKARGRNRNKWIVYTGEVNGHKVEIKSFDCSYLQIFRVDGLNGTPAMDISVTAWKQFIIDRLK